MGMTQVISKRELRTLFLRWPQTGIDWLLRSDGRAAVTHSQGASQLRLRHGKAGWEGFTVRLQSRPDHRSLFARWQWLYRSDYQ